MRSFFKYIIVVCLITGIISTLFFYFINNGLKKNHSDIYGKMNELVLGHEPFDVAFIGSSRVNLTVNPEVIDSVAKVNSFNFGFDGANIVDFEMHVRAYLKSHPKPKLFVLNIDPKMLNVETEIKVPSKYLPYIDHPEIYDSLKNYSRWPFVAKYLPFVATSFYTDAIVNQSVQGYIAPDRKMLNYYKGFSPLTRVWSKGDLSAADLLAVVHTPKGFSLFRSFLAMIRKEGIPLYLMYSPQYFFPEYDGMHRKYMDELNKVAFEYGYEITDYSALALCHDKKYFFDATHLNIEGANLFSKKLAEDIRDLFNNVKQP